MNKLLKSDKTMAAIKSAKDWKSISETWAGELAAFKAVRAKYLLYS